MQCDGSIAVQYFYAAVVSKQLWNLDSSGMHGIKGSTTLHLLRMRLTMMRRSPKFLRDLSQATKCWADGHQVRKAMLGMFSFASGQSDNVVALWTCDVEGEGLAEFKSSCDSIRV